MDLSKCSCGSYCILSLLTVLFLGQSHGLPVDTSKDPLKTAVDNIIIQEKSGILNLTFNEETSENDIATNVETSDEDMDNGEQSMKGVVDSEMKALDETMQSVDKGEAENANTDDKPMQNDEGLNREFPTAKIIVTVMKRSGRYWEPWELNYSKYMCFILYEFVSSNLVYLLSM